MTRTIEWLTEQLDLALNAVKALNDAKLSAEAERDAANRKRSDAYLEVGKEQTLRAIAESSLTVLRAENERLRRELGKPALSTDTATASPVRALLAAALANYGAHESECGIDKSEGKGLWRVVDDCTCGFDGALSAAEFLSEDSPTEADIARTLVLSKRFGWELELAESSDARLTPTDEGKAVGSATESPSPRGREA